MKFSLISLALLLLAISTVCAQNTDRVITVRNDTVLCKLTPPGIFSMSVSDFGYIPAGSKRPIKIKESAIKEFYSADRKTWYKTIVDNEGQPVFMRVLELGKISLYEAIVYAANGQVTNWYATKNNDTAVYIKTDGLPIVDGTKKGRKAFVAYLADNKPIHDRYIAEDNPPIEEIKNLIHRYNTGHLYNKP